MSAPEAIRPHSGRASSAPGSAYCIPPPGAAAASRRAVLRMALTMAHGFIETDASIQHPAPDHAASFADVAKEMFERRIASGQVAEFVEAKLVDVGIGPANLRPGHAKRIIEPLQQVRIKPVMRNRGSRRLRAAGRHRARSRYPCCVPHSGHRSAGSGRKRGQGGRQPPHGRPSRFR